MIVEWNNHMFSSDFARYPYYPNATYHPAPERLRADPLADYLQRMKTLGIDRAVIVQPEPYGDDHRLVLECLEREQTRIKGTCLFMPRDPDAPSKLTDLVQAHPRLIALRFHHTQIDRPLYFESFDQPYVRRLMGRAGELGLVIELHIGPSVAQHAARAIADYPQFRFLIDHLGNPQAGTPEQYEDILALARFPNTMMRLSALFFFSKEQEPYLDTKPLVQRVAAAFGPDRLGWATGTPSIVDALLDNWSEADRAKVKGENFARLAGFVS